jgi:PAS domain-containing protein
MVSSKKRIGIKEKRKARKQVADWAGLLGQSQSSITEHMEVGTALQADRDRDYSLFESVPISLWEEDFSAVKTCIDDLRRQGVKDFREYFENNREAVARCVGMVRIVDVNQATLALFKTRSKSRHHSPQPGHNY